MNYQVQYDDYNGQTYVEFLDEQGKVKFSRDFYGWLKEPINDIDFMLVPDFRLLDHEERKIDNRGNIYILNKRSGNLK